RGAWVCFFLSWVVASSVAGGRRRSLEGGAARAYEHPRDETVPLKRPGRPPKPAGSGGAHPAAGGRTPGPRVTNGPVTNAVHVGMRGVAPHEWLGHVASPPLLRSTSSPQLSASPR